MPAYLTQPLKRAALVNRNGFATVDGERRRSWTEVLERVARAAGGIAALGIGRGDRVALLALNSDRYFELEFALPWAGAAMVPINTRLSPAEVAYVLRDSGAVALVVDDSQHECAGQLGDILSGMKAVISLSGAGADGWIDYETMLAEASPLADRMRGGDEMAGIFYTGGSSGRSKGVVLTHDNLSTNALNAVALIGYGRESVYLHAAPMFHLTDGMSTYSLTMAGGTHVFMPRFDARQCLELIQAHGVTHICLVPTMIEMLVNLAEKERFDCSSLRQIQFGAAPMPDATLARAIRLWPDLLFLHGWGMTEISPLGMLMPFEWRDPRTAGHRMRSCGMPVYNEEARIVAPDGSACPPGEVGELVVRGPMVMKEYWNLPEETAKALRDGWMHTGDAAYVDDEGFFYIVDRIKDMIITGGENVYSLEVENVIGLMEGVKQVAVIGVPDPFWGETVHAVVVPQVGAALEPEAIIGFCKDRIARYKSPRTVEFRDSLPLTGAGKISKKQLREEHVARTAASSVPGESA
ncbi:class I adenylate-forming enzyme family protein [Aquibium microcysteis]|uniref:class I adenylate-forming enzyme family protein n=1 Tax=Aquibium microcysteis TaxID=675281 RepID=UPI00165CEEF6|nr:long-chain fatty acid--CoA ligase [Aquibium microcysteis]